MNSRWMGAWFAAVLMLVCVTGMVQAETELKELGLSPLYGPEIKSNEQFRQMIKETLPDLKEGFEKAGAAALFEDFVVQAGGFETQMIEVNPGERLQWMIFRKEKTVKVAKDLVWEGKEPFTAFLVQVDKTGTRYVFVIQAKSGNVSLAMTTPVPAVALAPNLNAVPFCEVVIAPVSLPVGSDVTIDASQSADPDGIISSVLIQVTDADNNVVKKTIDQPPFIEHMTMSKPGNYEIRVSATDNKGKEAYSPGCPETKITVTPTKEVALAPWPGNFVADLGYMYQGDPEHFLLLRMGYDYHFTDYFSLLGMVGAAPVLKGAGDADSLMIDLTAHLHSQRMDYGAGVGFWHSDMGDKVDCIVNAAYRFYGEKDQLNVSVFVEGRAAFDQFDKLADFGRLGAGLRFQF